MGRYGLYKTSCNRFNRWRKDGHLGSADGERNHVGRFFNGLKQFRRIATRHEKLGANYFVFLQLTRLRLWARSIESTT